MTVNGNDMSHFNVSQRLYQFWQDSNPNRRHSRHHARLDLCVPFTDSTNDT